MCKMLLQCFAYVYYHVSLIEISVIVKLNSFNFIVKDSKSPNVIFFINTFLDTSRIQGSNGGPSIHEFYLQT